MFNCCVMSKMRGRRGRLDLIPEIKMESFPAEMSSYLLISSPEVYLVSGGVIKSSLANGSLQRTLRNGKNGTCKLEVSPIQGFLSKRSLDGSDGDSIEGKHFGREKK